MIEVRASVTAPALKALARLSADQIPFATAMALTAVAGLTQKQIQKELPHEFKIRRPWTAGGIRFEMARKKDWPKVAAKVGSIDPYMVDFEAGGPHTTEGTRATGPKSEGTTAFVVPANVRKLLGLSDLRVIPQSAWPARMLKGKRRGGRRGGSKRTPFLQVMPSGKVGVFVRTGEFRMMAGRRRERITLLWELNKKPSKAPRKQWLVRTAQAMMDGHLGEEFERAMAKAMATAR